ncbi:hypothetical protein [Pseudarthrobacter sp. NamB4]|uniref:hypothetical protein n=1 Tax=Pseudarthrobacter sp. NamB4 TaxID=2576837 RepID=UPI0010FD2475|nr:hypothetical protein [Pseudarthrobacter sp. NamB4]TLM71171.1 hypothetical protein FDW81_16505 [Pseudarthrobacter sp. NamB4]
MSSVQPPGPGPPPQDSALSDVTDRAAIGSLILAFLSPISIYISGPIGLFTMLLTAGPTTHTPLTWLAPVFFWSLPFLVGVSSVSLARSCLRKSRRLSSSWVVAMTSLTFMGIFFLVGLLVTLHFLSGSGLLCRLFAPVP